MTIALFLEQQLKDPATIQPQQTVTLCQPSIIQCQVLIFCSNNQAEIRKKFNIKTKSMSLLFLSCVYILCAWKLRQINRSILKNHLSHSGNTYIIHDTIICFVQPTNIYNPPQTHLLALKPRYTYIVEYMNLSSQCTGSGS